MCFAPQRRALFRHLNLQKWSEPGVLCTFWLPNVLRATTACNFSTSQLPKEIRTWGVFSFFTWTYASRHNACNFSSRIWPHGSVPAALASLLFDPPEPQIIGKHSAWRLCHLFPHLHLLSPGSCSSLLWSSLFFSSLLFFSLLFSSLLLSSPLVSSRLFSSFLFSSLLFSDSSYLCFSICPFCRSLTSKLPSMKMYIYIYKFIYLYKCMYVKYI